MPYGDAGGRRFIEELPRTTPVKAETEVLGIGSSSCCSHENFPICWSPVGASQWIDHRVHHATKDILPCVATGEAAGTAAALAVRAGREPKQLDVAELQRRLEERGAILRL